MLRHLKELTSSPAYEETIREVKKDILDELVNTNIGELQKREALYFEYRGFEKIVERLASRVGELAMIPAQENKDETV